MNDQRDRNVWVSPQVEFLRAVHRVAPDVIHELGDIYDTREDASRQEALEQWGIRWHLTADWCIPRAIEEFVHTWQFLIDHVWPVPAFTFSHPGTHPKWISKTTAKEEISAACEKAFNLYWGAMEDELRQDGCIDPKDHHTREHYVWAARFQVGGETFTQIAKSVGTSHQNVTKMIRETLRRIDLTSRHVKKGRPKKSAR